MTQDAETVGPRPPAAPVENRLAAEARTLEVRLLGSFEISRGEEPISGFESQSVRALLAYLAVHPGRSIPRELLASLLWPEESERTARHNLRQALYNLRTALRLHGHESPLHTSHRAVSFQADDAVWVDVHELESVVGRELRGSALRDPQAVAQATHLYRGDFLAGFYVRDNPAFEEWMVGEQERLRELAVSALRQLVARYQSEGSYPLAIQFARQLLRIEPFSEDTHRQLMQLYALSGRRSRALAHYDDLRRLFQRELGVAPLEATTELYQLIQSEGSLAARTPAPSEPGGPLVPLVEREEALERLGEIWAGVRRGNCRLTLVEGELGLGKTRLIRTFLDRITAQGSVLVLQGSNHELAPRHPYQPVAEALRNAIATETDVVDRVLAAAGKRTLSVLLPLIPELADHDPGLARQQEASTPPARAGLFSAIARVLELLVERPGPTRPGRAVVLFLDDLHGADNETSELLESLLERLAGLPVWLLCAYRPSGLTPDHRLQALLASLGSRAGLSHLRLEPLGVAAAEAIATALLGKESAEPLARLLSAGSCGNPLVMTEMINLLWDQGQLQPDADGPWRLDGDAARLEGLGAPRLPALIDRRIQRLPRSARRLLALAGVVGPTFAASLLEHVEQEHSEVVATGINLMVEHWLVRHSLRYWADSRRERDLAVIAAGSRLGSFEFAHKYIRQVVYERLPADRRASLHREVAVALEAGSGEPRGELREAIAHHLCLAGDWAQALGHLEAAAERAQRLHATSTARHYLEAALHAVDALAASGRGDLDRRRTKLERALARLASQS